MRITVIISALLLAASLTWRITSLQQTAYENGLKTGRGEGDVKVLKLQREHAKALTDSEIATRQRLEALTSRLLDKQHSLNEIAGQLATQQRQYRDTTDRLTGELARVTTLYRRSLDATPEPLPTCVFTRDFVRLYDTATGAYPLSATGDPRLVVAPSSDTTAAGELDSGITQQDFLAHHIRYAEQCRATAAQLNKLIDTVESTHATRN
ncbi:hypothetical protein [Aeromonas hydrophila]|uniref:hypothetical protein n=1 Tax=Aeromonas hydrophila TaxID=644 RepID=UPI00069100E2|nr:hypothetical protein [Aeromonas hydrophila]